MFLRRHRSLTVSPCESLAHMLRVRGSGSRGPKSLGLESSGFLSHGMRSEHTVSDGLRGLRDLKVLGSQGAQGS